MAIEKAQAMLNHDGDKEIVAIIFTSDRVTPKKHHYVDRNIYQLNQNQAEALLYDLHDCVSSMRGFKKQANPFKRFFRIS